jgi:hypothetical protein
MWLNATYGDCVTAEEAFAKACNKPEIFIQDSTVFAWATKNGVLNGTDLITVLDLMQKNGFVQGGSLYNDGPSISVDWTKPEIFQNAIFVHGPVKLGVAADQLENVVPDPPKNGWVARGFTPDNNLDHCIGACGFGTMEWLTEQLGSKLASPEPSYAVFTWDSIGVIGAQSLLAITGEAWIRNPTTVVSPVPG